MATFGRACWVLLWLWLPCLLASEVPIIDLAAWTNPSKHSDRDRLEVAKQVGDACRDIGFFAVVNHGLSDEIIENALDASRDFFDLPLEEKLKAQSKDDARYPYGYENRETLAAGKGAEDEEVALPDLKETFAIGPSNPKSGMPDREWPNEPWYLHPALAEYYACMEELSLMMVRIFAVALKLPQDWIVDRMDHHFSALRVLNYFPIDPSKVSPGQLRASAHTDYGALTILKSGGPGLQVRKDLDEEEERWVDVPHLDDAFVINIGDMMQRWTNGR